MFRDLLELASPSTDRVSFTEKALSALAALAGIALVLLASSMVLAPAGLPLVVASMGASAVLLFAVPMGPMSQPWSFAGGHLISALIGITVARLVPGLVPAATLAVALAILAMYVTGCLHPPGGATALAVVIGGPSVHALGYQFLLTPLLLNIIVLLSWALLINNLLPNRHYPSALEKLRSKRKTGDDRLQNPLALTAGDLNHALNQMHEFIDISEEDLMKIFNLATTHARRRLLGEVFCHQIMSRNVISATPDMPAERLWALMSRHQIRGLPVIDSSRMVIGIVTIADFLNLIREESPVPLHQRFAGLVAGKGNAPEPRHTASAIMTAPAIVVSQNAHILELFPIFARHGIHHLPVVDEKGRLSGIITPKNLLATLQDDFADLH